MTAEYAVVFYSLGVEVRFGTSCFGTFLFDRKSAVNSSIFPSDSSTAFRGPPCLPLVS